MFETPRRRGPLQRTTPARLAPAGPHGPVAAAAAHRRLGRGGPCCGWRHPPCNGGEDPAVAPPGGNGHTEREWQGGRRERPSQTLPGHSLLQSGSCGGLELKGGRRGGGGLKTDCSETCVCATRSPLLTWPPVILCDGGGGARWAPQQCDPAQTRAGWGEGRQPCPPVCRRRGVRSTPRGGQAGVGRQPWMESVGLRVPLALLMTPRPPHKPNSGSILWPL